MRRNLSRRRPKPKFHRATPEVRREALVDATLKALRTYGHDGTSTRRISALAGVSVGLINHYYPGKAALVASAYDSLATALLESIRSHARAVEVGPRQRLHRFFEASFAPEVVDPELFHVWLVFWSMIAHAPEMRSVHDRTYAAYRAALETLLEELRQEPGVPPFQVHAAAIGLSALLDGLWIESSLNSATLNPAFAVKLCDDYVCALSAGALPGLRDA